MNKKISIIIPVYNEEAGIEPLILELEKTLGKLAERQIGHEIIFVNDGSRDGSGEAIKKACQQNADIKYLEFSRNFGKEIATSAGIHHATGDAAVMMDADLQHPPAVILDLVEKWQQGAEVVVGVRKNSAGGGFFHSLGAWFYYKIMALISEGNFIPNATDFRLIDRQVMDEFCRLSERNRITRGLIDWLGFKRDYVYFQADLRRKGEARYGFLKLTKLAISAFVAHSLFPLKAAGYLGVVISFFSGFLGLFIIINDWILADFFDLNFSNVAKLAVLNIFLIGIVLSSLGLIALYIGNIHAEVQNRPMYVVREKKNLT
jgi:polyisoprenyl-phosphate glycosyltransferase